MVSVWWCGVGWWCEGVMVGWWCEGVMVVWWCEGVMVVWWCEGAIVWCAQLLNRFVTQQSFVIFL
jgi:hypothetical protein